MPTPAQIVSKLDTKIDAILDNPDTIASYRLGEKQVSRGEILGRLLEARRLYQELDEKNPYEDIRRIALDVGVFGEDESEYIGDD